MKAVLAIGIGIAITANALAQVVIVDNRMGGFAYNSAYNRLYSLRSQVDFTGVVTGIQRVKPRDGMDTGVTLLVKNDAGGGTAIVELGPSWFVDRQITKIKPKQRVQVIGSKVFVDGRGVILAKLVRTGNEVLALRRVNGRPYWDIAEPVVLGPDPNVFELTGVITDSGIYGTGADAYAGVVLQTPGGAVNIDLGPQWFWQPQGFVFNPGTNLTIATGGSFRVDPYANTLPAYWLRSGNNTFMMRNPANGMGIWQGWRP